MVKTNWNPLPTPIDLNVAREFLHISTFVPNKDRNSSSSGLCRGLHELGRQAGKEGERGEGATLTFID